MDRSTLELHWQTRSGINGRTERRFLDFVIDGVSLHERLQPLDHVTGLGCWAVEHERDYIRQLLLRAPTELPSGRVPLYLCGECGCLDCGAIAVSVERTPEGFLWRDFAWETDDPEVKPDLEACQGIGPFLFNKTEYWQLLNARAVSLV